MLAEVAVIGAGASGLVASRHLLGQGLRPSIFEAAKTLGGAWGGENGKTWQSLTTNLSKHTCRFSEWPWPNQTPIFPSATDMHSYLESYADHFVDPTCFQYHCQVTKIERLSDSSGYRVEWTDTESQTKQSKVFKGVVVATGFFCKPHVPEGLNEHAKVSHSADYVSHEAFNDQSVAVVGSSFSALEIAADVSQSAKRVVSIVPSIPWVVPRFIPHDGVMLPVDLAFYRRAKEAPQLPENTRMTPSMARAKHEYLHNILGPKQRKSPLGIPQDWDKPPIVAISDHYLDLVIQGDIDVIQGRLQGIDETGVQIVDCPEGSLALPDIDKVICCTGYASDLSYLSDEISETIGYDELDTFSPITTCWDTLHPSLPNLFFCGMYRGPYMGIMEQQGRVAAGVLSGEVKLEETKQQEALRTCEQIRTQEPRAQFPHFDYLGLLDTLSEPLRASYPKYNTEKGDMVSPAFYQDNDDLAKQEQAQLDEVEQKGKDGSLIPSLVLGAIIGSWSFDRNMIHFSDNRREHVHGTVKYSRPKLNYVLYREDGFYEYMPGKVFEVFREYEYLVKGDTLEIYFVESGKRAHLFLSLKFTERNDQGYWVATSDHLCIKDLYKANFRVKLDGVAATEIIITYRVKGPAKDYESVTTLTPQK